MTRRSSSQAAFSLFAFQDIITSVTGIMILVTLMLAIELLNRTQNAPPAQTTEQVEVVQKTLAELQREIESLEEQLANSSAAIEDLPSLDDATLRDMAAQLDEDSARLRNEIDELNKKIVEKQRQADKARREEATEGAAADQQLAQITRQNSQAESQLEEIFQSDRMFFTSGIKGKTTFVVEITSGGLAVAQIGAKAPPKHYASPAAFQQWIAALPAQTHAFYLIVKPTGVANFEAAEKAIRQRGFEFGFDLVSDQKKIIDQQNGVSAP